jgi:hypothetical protein
LRSRKGDETVEKELAGFVRVGSIEVISLFGIVLGRAGFGGVHCAFLDLVFASNECILLLLLEVG